jgi:EAL domain-containing protein (putative c-di-GMP-specific phosphodiesterase class I)
MPTLSLEIGAQHFLNARFLDSMMNLMREAGTQPNSIEILLTEATTLASFGQGTGTIAKLAAAGIRFGLRGFSMNAGSHLDLHKLPFTSLRVSCSSLFKVTSPGESLWLARSIIAVARRCSLQFVAEDVTTLEQKQILIQGGCERFEGPLLSSPIHTFAMRSLLLEPTR